MPEKRTVYTVGYQRVSLDAIQRAIEETNSMLVDVRYLPASRMPEFSRKRLSERFGPRYRWEKGFGNVNYKDNKAPIELFNFKDGANSAAMILKQRSIILLCACKDLATCHRLRVAELLSKLFQIEVIHLEQVSTTTVTEKKPKQGELFAGDEW